MKREDKTYLCQLLANLSGLPVRLLINKKPIFYCSSVTFEKDPIKIHIDELNKIDAPIGYYLTKDFLYYGFINTRKETLIIGPTSEVPLNKSILRKIAFDLELKGNEIDNFELSMQSLVNMPIQTMLQILCAIYFGFTGDKKTIKDVTIIEDTQNEFEKDTSKEKANVKEFLDDAFSTHNTYSVEQALLNMIRHGNLTELTQWTKNAPSIRPGIIAKNQLRQVKNTFIVSTTLASRAAIEGGLNIEDALSLSDLYIKKCEALDTIDRITNLQYHMILDFTSQVQNLRIGDTPSALVLKVSNYVHHHITEHIDTGDIANALSFSRSYLSTAFKDKTGIPLASFVMGVKIDEAKNLLTSTNKTLAEISSFLCFSSQSYFSTTFKKYEGISPSEYRKKLV